MRRIPAPDGSQAEADEQACPEPACFTRPTVSGIVTAGACILLLTTISVLLLIPSVFYLIPIPHEADALTLCLPGIGPVQRFKDGLHPTQEELTFIHEAAHARQCRALGAAWYARQAVTPRGRLVLEVRALCAEAAVLAGRGADRSRLRDWTLEALRSEYFDDGAVSAQDIAAAVDDKCFGAMGD